MAGEKRILIVGRSGQLARALASAEWPNSIEAWAIGRPSLDLHDHSSVASTVRDGGWACVVNAAAYTQVDKAEAEPDAAYAVNRDGVAALADSCARANIPLVQVSTDYVFDGTKVGPYAEDDPIHPLSVYGISKAAGESAVRARLEAHVILRTSWLFSSTANNFVTNILRLVARQGKELRVVNDQHGRPSAAQDVAKAIMGIITVLLEGKLDGFGTFHFANAGATTWHDFAREILDQAALRGFTPVPRLTGIPTSEYSTPARRPLNSVLDTQRLTDIYGIAPRRWNEVLSETLDALIYPLKTCDPGAAR
jgi:dTDP-4-dehydrorhamnose reductase